MKIDWPFKISKRFIRVWQRDLMVYKKTWAINFVPPLLEPLLYILAFGLGLGAIVGKIDYHAAEISYAAFIAPALISITIMYNAFFENTYVSFVRMYYQKTFDSMMATPLSIEDIITGEIIWGATKSVIAASIMMFILSLFGLIQYPAGIFIIPVAFLGGFAFGSVGMFFTSIIPNIETFNLPVFLFITPMFLFSETFFPLTHLPVWAKKLSLAFPLTHLVQSCRAFSLGIFDLSLLLNFIYLVFFSIVFFPLALFLMRRRLIK
ncbi:ABC transporter permease [bacterium]|nr:ABC transporter permease [bacterium]